jgi:thiol-disulfide isomerase/thioredoxin
MPLRLLVLFVLLAGEVHAAENAWVLQGRVVDAQGRPVPNVDVTFFWNANGVPLAEIQRIEKLTGEVREREAAKVSENEGRMEPWGEKPAKTDADGRFSFPMKWQRYYAIAIDKERQQGALILSNSSDEHRVLTIRLTPLVRMRGRVRVAGSGRRPDSSIVVARLPENENFPLANNRLAICCSSHATFDILLPPGKYELEANGDLAGHRYELASYRPITLQAGVREVDAGILEFTPPTLRRGDRIREAQATGTWPNVDHTKLYGKSAPKWHAVDARGIAKSAQVADLKGKWVLVYFWGPWCSPCLGRELPALMEFYETHKADRDRFEIVTVCSTEPAIKTMADLDRELKPVVKAVWHGKQLPFPIILDNTLKSVENFGIAAHKLLFDPEGRLVPGDEKTLAEKLVGIAPHHAVPNASAR